MAGNFMKIWPPQRLCSLIGLAPSKLAQDQRVDPMPDNKQLRPVGLVDQIKLCCAAAGWFGSGPVGQTSPLSLSNVCPLQVVCTYVIVVQTVLATNNARHLCTIGASSSHL